MIENRFPRLKARIRWCGLWLLGCLITGGSWVDANAAITGPSIQIVREGSTVPETPIRPAVSAWGDNTYGQNNIPFGLTGLVAIAAGGNHTVALKLNGTVAAWGDNVRGQTSVPAGLNGVVAVAAGTYHSVALKEDGTVVAWGWNGVGQTSVPGDLSGVVAIAAGGFSTFAVKQDGRVVAWGGNGYGQTSLPAGLSGVVAVAAGSYHTVALKQDGSVVAWGRFYEGQTNVPAGMSGVVAVAAGGFHTVALKRDGSVVAWGDNLFGQISLPAGLSEVAAIAAGEQHTVALKRDGTVVAWGSNTSGQSSVPTNLTSVAGVAAGNGHTVAFVPLEATFSTVDFGTTTFGFPLGRSFTLMNDGLVDAFGLVARITGQQANDFSIVGSPSPFNISVLGGASVRVRFTPTSIGKQTAVFSLSSMDPSMSPYAVTLTAMVLSPQIVVTSPNAIIDGSTMPIGLATPVGAPAQRHCTLANTGNVSLDQIKFTIDGNNADDFQITPAAGSTLSSSVPPGGSMGFVVNFTPAAVGARTAALHIASNDPIHPSINLRLTGQGNELYLTFAKTNAPLDWPAQAVDLGSVVTGSAVERSFTVSNRSAHTLTGLRLVAEGMDAARLTITPALPDTLAAGASVTITVRFTALGKDTRSASLRVVTDDPNQTPGTINFTARVLAPQLEVRDSMNKVMSYPSLGTKVVTWLYNRASPLRPLASLSDVTAISAGANHTVALKQDGGVVAWGQVFDGQTYVPAGLTGVVAVAAGGYHSLALKQDGSVVAWGGSIYNEGKVPAGLAGVVAISAGGSHSLALKQDGSVVAWGNKFSGQTKVPPGLGGVVAVAAGGEHSVALKRDGTVVAWGNRYAGQNNMPLKLTGVTAVAAGGRHTVALKQDGTVVAWGDDWYQQTKVPSGLRGVTAIEAGYFHTLALKQDGTVVAWGGASYPLPKNNVPVGLSGVTAISAGYEYSVALVEAPGDFGDKRLGTERTHRINLANVGSTALTVSAAIEGPDADQFSLLAPLPDYISTYGSSELSYQFKPTRAGTLHAALKISSNDPDNPVYTLDLVGIGTYVSKDATKPGVKGSSLVYSPPVADRATGAVIQKITFVNSTGAALNGLRLLVSRLASGVTLQSSSVGNKPGVVEVIYSKPIAVGETISLTLTYHDPLRRTNLQPVIHAESMAYSEPREGPVDGVLVSLTRVRDSVNGPVLEWKPTVRKTYVVEYSDDAGNTWYSAVHRLVAGSARFVWTDRGQPETWSKPVNKAARMYRVRQL